MQEYLRSLTPNEFYNTVKDAWISRGVIHFWKQYRSNASLNEALSRAFLREYNESSNGNKRFLEYILKDELGRTIASLRHNLKVREWRKSNWTKENSKKFLREYDTSPKNVRNQMAEQLRLAHGVSPMRLRYELLKKPFNFHRPGPSTVKLQKYTQIQKELDNLANKLHSTQLSRKTHQRERRASKIQNDINKLKYITSGTLLINMKRARQLSPQGKAKLRVELQHTNPITPFGNYINPQNALQKIHSSAELSRGNAARLIQRAFLRHAAPGGYLYKHGAANVGVRVDPNEKVPSANNLEKVRRSGQLSLPR
jgi:hypothetical protein